MRLLSYTVGSEPGFGLVSADGDGVIALRSRIDGVEDLGALLDEGRWDAARELADLDADHPWSALTVEVPVRRPGKIFCIGVNYGGRSAEYSDPTDAAYPSVFVRFVDSFTGHGQALLRPPESEQLDYEGEIVAVIGRAGRRIPVDQARSHLAGLTLGNEGTIRDWVRHAKFNVTQGKNWERSGAIGPWMVSMDEVPDLTTLHLTTRVNGEVRQDDTTATMKYPIDYLIHYLSTFTALHPGDLVFTGTPTGAGARSDPPVWLRPDDVVEVSVPEIGTLRNTVADEPTTAIAAPEPR